MGNEDLRRQVAHALRQRLDADRMLEANSGPAVSPIEAARRYLELEAGCAEAALRETWWASLSDASLYELYAAQLRDATLTGAALQRMIAKLTRRDALPADVVQRNLAEGRRRAAEKLATCRQRVGALPDTGGPAAGNLNPGIVAASTAAPC
jgi:hypothetical protein